MNKLNKEYRKDQLNPLDLKGEFNNKIKLRNPNNNKETLWLNITYEEYVKIKNILNGDE